MKTQNNININLTLEEQRKIQELSYLMFNSVVAISNPLHKREKLEISDIKYRSFVLKDYSGFSKKSLGVVNIVLSQHIPTPSELTKSFYEAWEDVESKSREELLSDQIIHYLTTYGLGLQGDDVYVPNSQELEIPEVLIKNIKIIDVISLDEYLKNIKEFFAKNIALDSKDISLLIDVIKIFRGLLDGVNVSNIKNKELRDSIRKEFDIIPNDAEEFLRYIVQRTTDNSLFIKNSDTITAIKDNISYSPSSVDIVKRSFNNFIQENGYTPLAEIFNRNKRIFLAFKGDKDVNKIINKISKLSKTNHKPKITPDYLKITSGEISVERAVEVMENLDISYLIKVLNALSYRKTIDGIGIYHIRNGKSFVKESWNKVDSSIFDTIFEGGRQILEKKLNERIQDLKLKITNFDDMLQLALPTSGKQFVGNIPWYSKINRSIEDLVVGIYWENLRSISIDLDLSCSNESQKIGWDSSYYSSNGGIVFSGDMTDATNGAVEVFKFNNIHENDTYVMNLNFFNGHNKDFYPFSYKFFIGKQMFEGNNRVKMINPDNLVYSRGMELESRQEAIGFVRNDGFIFGKITFPASNTADLTSSDLIKAVNAEVDSKIKFSDLDLVSYDGEDFEIELDLGDPKKDTLLSLVQ